MKKLAVFISGPIRYLDKVIENLELCGFPCDYEYFIHVWMDEESNDLTKREATCKISDIHRLSKKIRTLIIEKPIDSGFVESKYGSWTDTHSKVSSLFGMFTSVSKLYNTLRCDVAYSTYTHIFRVRTDISFLNHSIFNCIDLNSDDIYVSRNNVVPRTWVSDHLMLAKIKSFEKIWSFYCFDKFEVSFSRYARNPEFYLGKVTGKSNIKSVWVRYEDYHIVYQTPLESDPTILKTIQNKDGVKGIFDFKHDKNSLDEVIEYNQTLKSRHCHYDLMSNKLKRLVKRLINKKKAV